MVLVMQSEKRGVKIDPTLELQGLMCSATRVKRVCQADQQTDVAYHQPKDVSDDFAIIRRGSRI